MERRISAVVCTYNRERHLRRALTALLAQSLPSADYEILVVDNGSTDDTPRLVQDEFGHVRNLEYVAEPRSGLSHARNTGFRRARAPWVAYTDDDAVPDERWLETLLHVFETVVPVPGCVGGRIDPVWEAPRPAWLADELLPFLTVLHWTDSPGLIHRPMYLAGANIAFPRAVLEEVGGFRTDLGRTPEGLASNEETALEEALRQRGYGCYYHPGAVVGHHVPPERLQRRFFLRRCWWQGVSDARLSGIDARHAQRGALAELRRRHVGPRSLVNLMRPTRDPVRFQRQCHTAEALGYVMTLLRG